MDPKALAYFAAGIGAGLTIIGGAAGKGLVDGGNADSKRADQAECAPTEGVTDGVVDTGREHNRVQTGVEPEEAEAKDIDFRAEAEGISGLPHIGLAGLCLLILLDSGQLFVLLIPSVSSLEFRRKCEPWERVGIVFGRQRAGNRRAGVGESLASH